MTLSIGYECDCGKSLGSKAWERGRRRCKRCGGSVVMLGARPAPEIIVMPPEAAPRTPPPPPKAKLTGNQRRWMSIVADAMRRVWRR